MNQMHNFLCYNGDPNRPQIFGNLLKQGVKQDVELRKKIEMLGNEQKYMNKLEKTFWATRNFKKVDSSYQTPKNLLDVTLESKARLSSPPLEAYSNLEITAEEKHEKLFKESMSKIMKNPGSEVSTF